MKRAAILLIAVLNAGCSSVYSFFPAVSESAAVTDDRMLGDWISADTVGSPLRVSVTRKGDRTYQFRFMDDDDTSTAIGRVMPIGRYWLLDLAPTEEGRKAIRANEGLPTHTQVILETSDRSIRAAALDADSIRAIARGRRADLGVALAFPPGGDVLLTDSTDALAKGITRLMAIPGVVHSWHTFHRPPAASKLREIVYTSWPPRDSVPRAAHPGFKRVFGGLGTGLGLGYAALHFNICHITPCSNWGFIQGGLAGYWLGGVLGTARVAAPRCTFAKRFRRAFVGSLPGVAISIALARASPMVKDMNAVAVTTAVAVAPLVTSSVVLRTCD
jgi:hypothetical protein